MTSRLLGGYDLTVIATVLRKKTPLRYHPREITKIKGSSPRKQHRGGLMRKVRKQLLGAGGAAGGELYLATSSP